jgi:hypothetical protein
VSESSKAHFWGKRRQVPAKEAAFVGHKSGFLGAAAEFVAPLPDEVFSEYYS